MFSISSYVMIIASMLSTICVGTPVNNSDPEKTQLLNVYTKPKQTYYKPVYIDMSDSSDSLTIETHLPIKSLTNYQK